MHLNTLKAPEAVLHLTHQLIAVISHLLVAQKDWNAFIGPWKSSWAKQKSKSNTTVGPIYKDKSIAAPSRATHVLIERVTVTDETIGVDRLLSLVRNEQWIFLVGKGTQYTNGRVWRWEEQIRSLSLSNWESVCIRHCLTGFITLTSR